MSEAYMVFIFDGRTLRMEGIIAESSREAADGLADIEGQKVPVRARDLMDNCQIIMADFRRMASAN